MDKRQHPRFPARFHSSFTSVTVVSGEGNVVDLSLRGCCVESKTSVHSWKHAHNTRAYAVGRTPDHHRRSRREVDPRGPLRYRIHLFGS